jgi:hypothetical protein
MERQLTETPLMIHPITRGYLALVLSGLLWLMAPPALADEVAERQEGWRAAWVESLRDSPVLGKDNRRSIGWAFAALSRDDAEDHAQADQVLSEVFDEPDDYWAGGKKESAYAHYWQLPLTLQILLNPELREPLSDATVQAMTRMVRGYLETKLEVWQPDQTPEGHLRFFMSDNHDLHNKATFLLGMQWLAEQDGPIGGQFSDGRTPKEHLKDWEYDTLNFLRARLGSSLVAEFASPIYARVWFASLFALRDHAESAEIRQYAEAMLDALFADASLESINGIRGGAKVRAAKNKVSYLGSADTHFTHVYLLTGLPTTVGGPSPLDGQQPLDSFALAASVSDYRLPEQVLDWYLNANERGTLTIESRRLSEGTHELFPYYEALWPDYIAQAEPALLRTSRVTPRYVLGWFTVDEAQTYMLVNAQNQWMGVVTDAAADSRIVFEMTPRPNGKGYRELQAVGAGSAVLLRRQLASAPDALLRVFISPDFQVEQRDGWVFARSGNGNTYVGLHGISPGADFTWKTEPAGGVRGRYLVASHRDAWLAAEVADSTEFSSFAEFQEAMLDRKPVLSNNADVVSYQPSRGGPELTLFRYAETPQVAGESVDLKPPYALKSELLSIPWNPLPDGETDTRWPVRQSDP